MSHHCTRGEEIAKWRKEHPEEAAEQDRAAAEHERKLQEDAANGDAEAIKKLEFRKSMSNWFRENARPVDMSTPIQNTIVKLEPMKMLPLKIMDGTYAASQKTGVEKPYTWFKYKTCGRSDCTLCIGGVITVTREVPRTFEPGKRRQEADLYMKERYPCAVFHAEVQEHEET